MQWVKRYYSAEMGINSPKEKGAMTFHRTFHAIPMSNDSSYFVQVGKFVQLMATFIGGFSVAFYKGWLLAVVMLSAIPLLVLAGASMALFISKMAARGQNAYAEAANVVEQTIGGIRTVCYIKKNNCLEQKISK
jgi:ABC-type multidrug transport system fused ATPase/permease subunit